MQPMAASFINIRKGTVHSLACLLYFSVAINVEPNFGKLSLSYQCPASLLGCPDSKIGCPEY